MHSFPTSMSFSSTYLSERYWFMNSCKKVDFIFSNASFMMHNYTLVTLSIMPLFHFSFSTLIWLGSLSERITSTTIYPRYTRDTRHTYFPHGNHKGENPAKFLRIVQSQIMYHKMNKSSNKKSYASIYLSSLSFSLYSCELEWVQGRINEGGHLPIYTFQVIDLTHEWGRPLTLIGSNSPRETPKINYMMSH